MPPSLRSRLAVLTLALAAGVAAPLSVAHARGPEDPRAIEAEAAEAAGEWREASWIWGRAYEQAPAQSQWQLRSGAAAMEAGDCGRAQRWLEAYLKSDADDKDGRARAEAILGQIGASQCATLNRDEATEKARGLYEQAEGLAAEEKWAEAVEPYEDAYFLVPEKVGFAYKVGKAAFEARRCNKAEEYLGHFMRYGDAEKHAELQRDAEQLLNRIETLGCKSAEAPPPSDKKGCSVVAPSGAGPLAALALLALVRRRRD